MIDSSRLLAVAAALILTLGTGAVSAQTLVFRRVPAGSTIEIAVNNGDAASHKSDAGGDVILPSKLFEKSSKTETDAQILVDSCTGVYRVALLERGHTTPVEASGCTRRDMGGWFVVKPSSSLVIDVGGPSPTLLLRQGSFSLEPPRTWRAPTGLVLFGGGSRSSFSNVSGVACGASVATCSGGDATFGFTAGVAYWIAPFLAAEATYIRPSKTEIQGGDVDYNFTSTLDPHIFAAVGKVGIPAGVFRPYGQIGANYHRATFTTTQTMTGVTENGLQTYSVETGGWSWIFGGGMEVWFSPHFGIYGELNRAAIKGPPIDEDVEGTIDDRMTTILFGARIRIGG